MKPLKTTRIMKPRKDTALNFWAVLIAGETYVRGKFATLDEAYAFAQKESKAKIVIE